MTVTVGTTPHKIFLAGKWVDSPDVLVVVNPATGEEVGRTYLATPEQYDAAVTAAEQVFDTTRRLPAYERGRMLRELSALVAEHRDEMAEIIVAEAGKPIRDARVEVDRAALVFRLGAVVVYVINRSMY